MSLACDSCEVQFFKGVPDSRIFFFSDLAELALELEPAGLRTSDTPRLLTGCRTPSIFVLSQIYLDDRFPSHSGVSHRNGELLKFIDGSDTSLVCESFFSKWQTLKAMYTSKFFTKENM